MGFGRRLARKSARRVARKTVRKATPRPVRQAMHPARTVRNAATPRPVKQVSRAAYAVRNPVGAAENKLIGAALYAWSSRRRKRRSGFWGSFGKKRGKGRPPATAAVTAKRPERPQSTVPPKWPQSSVPPRSLPLAPRRAAPATVPAEISRWNDGPGGIAFRAIGSDAADIGPLFQQVAALLRQAAADPTAGQALLNQAEVKLRNACARLGSDVTAAMAAPPIPDAEAQYWWARNLDGAQKAAADLRVGTETRNGAMIRQGSAGLRAVASDLAELTKRVNAIRGAAPPPRQVTPVSTAAIPRTGTAPRPGQRERRQAHTARAPEGAEPTAPIQTSGLAGAGEWELEVRRHSGLGGD